MTRDVSIRAASWPLMEPIPPEALLEPYPPEHQEVANALRRLIKRTVPDAVERVRLGWGLIGYDVPAGRRTRYFAFVWPEPEHVHLGFEHGVLMDDPDGLLKGAGVTKQVRWLTFLHIDDIPPQAADLIREAVRVATMSRAEQVARRIDAEERARAWAGSPGHPTSGVGGSRPASRTNRS